MVIEDATVDPRFADNPLVTGAPGIRFYAGVPLRSAAEGYVEDLPGIGTLCVLDTRPRTLSSQDVTTLREIAGLVSALIRARRNRQRHALVG
jgi:GAF domain-containing protein